MRVAYNTSWQSSAVVAVSGLFAVVAVFLVVCFGIAVGFGLIEANRLAAVVADTNSLVAVDDGDDGVSNRPYYHLLVSDHCCKSLVALLTVVVVYNIRSGHSYRTRPVVLHWVEQLTSSMWSKHAGLRVAAPS